MVLGHMTVVDEPLGKVHQVHAFAQGGADRDGIGESEQALIEAKTDEPANLVLHKKRREPNGRRVCRCGNQSQARSAK